MCLHCYYLKIIVVFDVLDIYGLISTDNSTFTLLIIRVELYHLNNLHDSDEVVDHYGWVLNKV